MFPGCALFELRRLMVFHIPQEAISLLSRSFKYIEHRAWLWKLLIGRFIMTFQTAWHNADSRLLNDLHFKYISFGEE